MVTEDEFAQSGPALINGRNCSVIPEMFAMMAMKKKLLRDEKYKNERHIIWTDSAQTVQLAIGINSWHKEQEGQEIVDALRDLVEKAEQKLDITIKWCKGHNEIEGNELADKAAATQVQRMKQQIKEDTEKATRNLQLQRKRKAENNETEIIEGTESKKTRIIEVEDDMESKTEWENLEAGHKEILIYLCKKMGGFEIGKDNLADKIWALKTATDEIVKLLIAAMKGEKPFDYQKMTIHKCRDKCPHIETVQQARKKEEENQKQDKLKKHLIEV